MLTELLDVAGTSQIDNGGHTMAMTYYPDWRSGWEIEAGYSAIQTNRCGSGGDSKNRRRGGCKGSGNGVGCVDHVHKRHFPRGHLS